ncbi:MAG: helix-turn-helix domain-containing protein [Clostridium sp.]|uniref:helix-turn-helix domain-containing protein n=1 Tax=Clostridium sp. TaxID=1506 RepID=UPI003D6CB1D7
MSDREFQELFILAHNGDTCAVDKILNKFKPCIIKNSIINGKFDEDCFQELNLNLIKCIYKFTSNSNDVNLKNYLIS